ncbi:hypothetical protein ACFQX7_27685 [Luedemannella flava]
MAGQLTRGQIVRIVCIEAGPIDAGTRAGALLAEWRDLKLITTHGKLVTATQSQALLRAFHASWDIYLVERAVGIGVPSPSDQDTGRHADHPVPSMDGFECRTRQ